MATTINVLRGVPTPEARAKTAAILLDPLMKFAPKIRDGRKLILDIDLDALNVHMVDRPNFSARGRNKCEVLFNWGRVLGPGPGGNGYLSTYIKASAVDQVVLLDAAIATVSMLQAPIAHLDLLGENSYRDRRDRHMQIYQEGKIGADRVFGYFRGFSGIPWRTVLGPQFVEYFGKSTLAALPGSLAREVSDGVWLLTPCEQPEDWTADRRCDGETAIIEALGADSFFDPQTSALPTTAPSLPEVLPIPVKVQRSTPTPPGEVYRPLTNDDPWEFHNGYVE